MGTSLGVQLAPTSFLGVTGWRLAFYAFAIVGVAVALSTWLLTTDSRPEETTPWPWLPSPNSPEKPGTC